MTLTIEEHAYNDETWHHIDRVRNLLDKFIVEIIKRGQQHDRSKLESPEVEAFTKHGPLLKTLSFESPEYNESRRQMKLALDHHYARSRHHPEHFVNGINDMNLVDILELLVDWKAASERQYNGNIRKSIDICADRFGISPQLKKILENTLEILE